jgi:hypothetical protein
MLPPGQGDASHPSAGDVSAYLDRTLPAPARLRMQAHLADCDECRREVVELSRLVRSQPRPRRTLRWAVAVGIAATLAILIGRMPGNPGTFPASGPPAPVERGFSDDANLSVWGPRAGASVTRDSLVLAWSPPRARDVQYRVTLSDVEGTVLWTGSTRDTILRVPTSLVLPGGQTYYWYTDALLPAGRSLTTGVQEFRMAP